MEHEEEIPIQEAVETLATIADLSPERDRMIRQEVILDGRPLSDRKVEWLVFGRDAEASLDLVRGCFRSVHNYLMRLYRKEDPQQMKRSSIEGIEAIMLVVGEAAKRLDHFSSLFHGEEGTKSLQEYRDLLQFYQRKISKNVEDTSMSRWVVGVGRLPFPALEQEGKTIRKAVQMNPAHLFVDMEAVQSDTEYELFFVRKEDGSRFFNPRLIKNMKMIADFGPKEDKVLPELLTTKWLDEAFHKLSREVIANMGSTLDQFLQERGKFKEKELQTHCMHAFLALLLAGHKKYLFENNPAKSCYDYFLDALYFLRQGLLSYDYQKLVSYPPRTSNHLGRLILRFIEKLAKLLYLETKGCLVTKELVMHLIRQGYEKDSSIDEESLSLRLSTTVETDDQALRAALKEYASSSLQRLLEDLSINNTEGFDPWIQGNLPSLAAWFTQGEKHISWVRMPTPTKQEFIHKPEVIEEFKASLREHDEKKKKMLLINLQNRTSWKEHDRSCVLEELGYKSEWEECLDVMTLEVDTEFYDQQGLFAEDCEAAGFKETLLEHMQMRDSGFFFKDNVEWVLFPLFTATLIDEVHDIFFQKRPKLTQEERCSFIDLTYFFCCLKAMESLKPDTCFFVCKDGVEQSNLWIGLSACLFTLFHDKSWGEREREQLNTLLFSPALVLRERAPLKYRIKRMIQTIALVEAVQEEMGASKFKDKLLVKIGALFHTPLLQGRIELF